MQPPCLQRASLSARLSSAAGESSCLGAGGQEGKAAGSAGAGALGEAAWAAARALHSAPQQHGVPAALPARALQ